MLRFHQNNLTPALDTRYPLSGNQQFDLIVAGAGTAGVAAAITAARSGHRTLLVARRSVLGGNSGYLLVHSMSGFYRTSPDVILYPRTVASPCSSPAASLNTTAVAALAVPVSRIFFSGSPWIFPTSACTSASGNRT